MGESTCSDAPSMLLRADLLVADLAEMPPPQWMMLCGRRPWTALVVGWIALVALGAWLLIDYSLRPGPSGAAPSIWPADSRLPHRRADFELVLAAHPRCPCTRASLAELELIMARSHGRLEATVLFVRPRGFTDDWTRSDLWRRASAIPGVTPAIDPLGEEARRFGAVTSGQCAVYEANGALVFSGGITGARGHAGDNAGRGAILALLANEPNRRATTSVFGCALHGKECNEGEEQTRAY